MKREINTGDQFNKWTVIEEVEGKDYACRNKGGAGNRLTIRHFNCQCQCGSEQVIAMTNLTSGASKGCRSCQTGKRMFTPDQVREIRKMAEVTPLAVIGRKFGTSYKTIYQIVVRACYKDVD